jgi:hypothetical protein
MRGEFMDWSRRRFFGAAGALTLNPAALRGAQAQSASADLVLFNGKIVTVEDAVSDSRGDRPQGRSNFGCGRQ